MRGWSLWVAAWAACALGMSSATFVQRATAQATASETEESAESPYGAVIREAVREYNDGNWAEARALFEQAHALKPNARTLLGLGITAFQLKRYAQSVNELEAALGDTRTPLTDAQRIEAQGLILKARAEIPTVIFPTVIFQAKNGDGEDVSAVQVKMDGHVVLAERLDGTALSIEAGQHTFVFETAGQPTVTKELVLMDGDKDRREEVVFPLSPCHAAAPGKARPIAKLAADGQTHPGKAFVIEYVQAYFGVEDFHLIVRSAERSADFDETEFHTNNLHNLRHSRFRANLTPGFIARIGALLPDLLSAPCLRGPVDPEPLDSTYQFVTVEQAGVKRRLRYPETHDPSPELLGLLREAEAQAKEHLVGTTGPGLGTQRTWALVAGGAGVGLLGLGSAFAVISLSKRKEAERLCPGRQCTTRDGANRWNDAADLGNVAIFEFVLGGAELALAAVLWLTASPASNHHASTMVGVGPGKVRLAGTW